MTVVRRVSSPIMAILPPIAIGSIPPLVLQHQTRHHPPKELDLVQDVPQDNVIGIVLRCRDRRGCGCGCGAAPATAAAAAADPHDLVGPSAAA